MSEDLNTFKDDTQEIINHLEEAQDKMVEAISHLNNAYNLMKKSDMHYSESLGLKPYLIDQLKILSTDDHGFLSNDLNVSKVISNMQRTQKDWREHYE